MAEEDSVKFWSSGFTEYSNQICNRKDSAKIRIAIRGHAAISTPLRYAHVILFGDSGEDWYPK